MAGGRRMRWRAGAERAARRVRGLGIGGWVRVERDSLLQVAKTALAAGLAWALAADVVGSELPALASLAAIITVQVTVYQTLTRALQYVVAVVLGLLVALAFARLVGVAAWSITLVIFGALVLGRALRLGLQANQVAISALLVVALGEGYAGERVVDTMVGAGVGVLVNLLVLPPTYVDAAGRSLRGVAEDLAALCHDVGASPGGQWGYEEARGWLSRARELDDELREVADALERGEESVRYNPRRTEAEVLARYGEAQHALEHGVNQVRGFVRTLTELASRDERWHEPADPVLEPLGRLLRAAGEAARAFGALQTEERSRWPAEREALRRALAQAVQAHDDAALRLRELPPGPVQRMLAALIVDAERLLSELDPDEGQHTAALPQ